MPVLRNVTETSVDAVDDCPSLFIPAVMFCRIRLWYFHYYMLHTKDHNHFRFLQTKPLHEGREIWTRGKQFPSLVFSSNKFHLVLFATLSLRVRMIVTKTSLEMQSCRESKYKEIYIFKTFAISNCHNEHWRKALTSNSWQNHILDNLHILGKRKGNGWAPIKWKAKMGLCPMNLVPRWFNVAAYICSLQHWYENDV